MKINNEALVPIPKPNQHLVQMIACALNPVDYKPAELAVVDRFINTKPATPGIDFAGRIIKPIPGSPYQPGQLVFGIAGEKLPIAGGGLAEYGTVLPHALAPIPEGLDPLDAATIGIAGLTALQTIGSELKTGDKIFINGGSGGTGVFGIQIAKAQGLFVTTTCSTPNIALCRSLGADEVIDYKKGNIIQALKDSGHKFDRVIDNVGGNLDLYWKCHEFTTPKAKFVQVAGEPSLKNLSESLKTRLLPGFLGGGKRAKQGFLAKVNTEDLAKLAEWMREGKVKAVIDTKFPFEEAVQAFEKLKTGRSKGKLVVQVAT